VPMQLRSGQTPDSSHSFRPEFQAIVSGHSFRPEFQTSRTVALLTLTVMIF